MANGADNLQNHVNQCAAYGGHDGKGGHQKPRGKVSQATMNPTNQSARVNSVPVTGPATGNGPMSGPLGSGGSSGAGN
jgi:hypothetical protein